MSAPPLLPSTDLHHAAGKPLFSADEFENSYPIDKGRRFRDEPGRGIVTVVLDGMDKRRRRIRARKPDDVISARNTVEALLANLAAGALNAVDPTRFVAVGFGKADYNGCSLSFKAMQECRDYLTASGLTDIGPGFRRADVIGDGSFGRRTRLRATEQLTAMFRDAGIGRGSLSIASSDLIRIKAQAKDAGPPPAHVEASKAVLEAVNRRLSITNISIPDTLRGTLHTPEVMGDEDRDTRIRRWRYAGDLSATSIYRAFKGDWRSGGRFYGGWWMSCPKAVRQHITIDGEPTVELDFKCLHPRLLYGREGLDFPLDFDPYKVWPWHGEPMRSLGKRTFNRLLNHKAADPAKAMRIRAAKGDREVLPPKISFREYRDALLANLDPIKHWLGTGEGIHLQYEDSELALTVMKTMEQEGVAVLPIHDSFIVDKAHGETLRLAMLDAFFEKYGDIPDVQ